ncbi:hypothetical protein [Planobispora takensis]|uniref:Capsular polysaccharide biosynthesis protein n=1 Tax=Planobispora takensis TaxID=1367882 RepID=A0A8J3WUT8_9ACTN|nr:hypothetical protein [Planobispora takensis]GII02350.1 hypothetical protein Pta02_43580 [Planobispora takensis]
MDFWRTAVVVFRRWYVTFPAFLVGLAAAYGAYLTVPTTYTSYAVMVVTIPTTGNGVSGDPEQPLLYTNPLANFDHGLSMTAGLLIQALSAPGVAAEIGLDPSGPTGYKVSNGASNPELLISGPFVFIEGESTTPQAAQDVIRKVMERARVELVKRQGVVGAPRRTYLTMTDVVKPTPPEAKRGSKLRAAGATLAVSAVLSLCAAFAAESFATARAERARRRENGGDGGDGGDAEDRAAPSGPAAREPAGRR